jgi:Tol biopolymer transport system component
LCPFLIFFLLGACAQPTNTPIPSSTPLSPTLPQPSNRTSTGFYWPTGTSDIGDYAGWLSDGCPWSGKNSYTEGEYHIGHDIDAGEGSNIYAISDGQVIHISENDWGAGNVGVLAEHKLDDGSSFTAVYGHLHTDVKKGDRLYAGVPFGTIGPYSPPHLHFGIRPGTSITAPYGIMTCPDFGPISDTNNFVDPILWITTRSPGVFLLPGATAPFATVAQTPIRTPPRPVPTPTPRSTLTPTSTVTQSHISYIGSDGNIWLMKTDGNNKQKLTDLTNPNVIEHAWSPDGTKISFINYESGILLSYLLDFSAGITSRLTDIPLASSGLSWSPDGENIAVPASIQNNTDIYAISVLDKSVRSLTNKPGSDYYRLPVWSPDGTTVAFILGEDINLLNIEDSSMKNITLGKYHVYSFPYWSRDGNSIGFAALPVELGICFEGDCDLRHYLIQTDGSQIIDLESSYGINGIPVWSPDGTMIIYVSGQDGNPEIYSASADWSNIRNLTNDPGDDIDSSWSPDGKRILFTSNRNGNIEIYIMNFDGSNLVNLTKSIEDEKLPRWQPPTTFVPLSTPQPALTPSAGTINIDITNPDDVIRWFSTALKQSNLDIFDNLFTEDTLLYGTGMAMEGGSDEITKDSFLQELAIRLPNRPTCLAYTINPERTLLMIWTKGWQPKWELLGQPTSETLTFSLLFQNGKIYTTAYFTPDPAILDLPSVESYECP